jgi:RNA polymerase sigma-70 factor (ECF subfamily)
VRRARYEALFGEVYQAVQRYVHRRAAPGDVDDVVADTMLVLWRRLDDVPSDLAVPWAYGVARRCLANHRRGADRRGNLHERLLRERPAIDPPSPAEDHDDALHAALAELDTGDRDVLRLWAWEGLAPREIATVLDISANAASIRLYRAKSRLAGALTGKEPVADGHSISRHADHEEIEQQ